jgi:hypothetical protein
VAEASTRRPAVAKSLSSMPERDKYVVIVGKAVRE